MLVDLINIPKNQDDWDLWSYAHREHHDEIRKAIQTQNSVNLTEFVLDPINFDPEWLKRNSETHQAMNGALNLQGSDLEDLDFENEATVKFMDTESLSRAL